MEIIILFTYFYMGLLMHCCANTEPKMKACIDNYELSFFCHAIVFEDALEACNNKGSYLVKIDNVNMTEIINGVIDRINCPYKEAFHAGATADDKRTWRWLDGSRVYLQNETGYQNWKVGQPNDINGVEDCLALEKGTTQWVDSPCSGMVNGKAAEQRYYICQKNLTLNIELEATSNKTIKCLATNGVCVNQVKWSRNKEIVSTFPNQSVYQEIVSGSSVLHYENATINDEGKYSCATWVRENKANEVSVLHNIKVNGTPTIMKIDASPCNSNLTIFWKPHPLALGFAHRIKVFDPMSADEVSTFENTPIEEFEQVTEISGLRSSTVYHIQISACKTENVCTDEYTVNATAATLGNVVKNATMNLLNNTCIVTWYWPYNISTVFKISINFTSDGLSRVNTFKVNAFVNLTGNKFPYSFDASSNKISEIQIKTTENSKLCPGPVNAAGSCIEEYRQTTSIVEESESTTGSNQIDLTSAVSNQMEANIVIPISAAGGGFVFLVITGILFYCKCRKCRRNSEKEKENPIYGIINTAATGGDYDHLHSTLSQQNAGNAANEVKTNEEKHKDNDFSAEVVNPLYGNLDITTKSNEGVLTEDQQDFTDTPIYAAVSKVKKKLNSDASSQVCAGDSKTEKTAASLDEETVYAVVDKNKGKK